MLVLLKLLNGFRQERLRHGQKLSAGVASPLILLAGVLALTTSLPDTPASAADEIHNVNITQEGRNYVITYDLTSPVPGFVDLFGSDDGGANYDILMEHVSGDVGRRVPPGTNLRIVWDAEKDLTGDLRDTDILIYPMFSFRKRSYVEQTEVEPVQTRAEYQEDLRREREDYTQWIRDSEGRLAEAMQERRMLQDRLTGLMLQTPFLTLSADSDARDRKKAERAEKDRVKDIERLQDDVDDLDREIDSLRSKIRQLKAERGGLE